MSERWVMSGKPARRRSGSLPAAYDEPAYRRSDLVILRDEGNFVFVGYQDGIVKTRGYRAEPGEI